MGILDGLVAAKAYQDGFKDGKEGATPRLVYTMAKQAGDPAGEAYFEGYEKGERSAADQNRHFID
jgi:hypothetical protein